MTHDEKAPPHLQSSFISPSQWKLTNWVLYKLGFSWFLGFSSCNKRERENIWKWEPFLSCILRYIYISMVGFHSILRPLLLLFASPNVVHVYHRINASQNFCADCVQHTYQWLHVYLTMYQCYAKFFYLYVKLMWLT